MSALASFCSLGVVSFLVMEEERGEGDGDGTNGFLVEQQHLSFGDKIEQGMILLYYIIRNAK